MMLKTPEASTDDLVVEIGEIDSSKITELFSSYHIPDLTDKFGGVTVQHRKGIPNPWKWIDGIGDLSLYSSYWLTEPEKYDTCATDFNVLNDTFKNTIIEHVINDYNLVRSRVLWKSPYTSYPVHSDASKTLHIPLITDENNFFYFVDHNVGFNLKLNKVYIVDTRENHLFVNASTKGLRRLHFVATLKDSLDYEKNDHGILTFNTQRYG